MKTRRISGEVISIIVAASCAYLAGWWVRSSDVSGSFREQVQVVQPRSDGRPEVAKISAVSLENELRTALLSSYAPEFIQSIIHSVDKLDDVIEMWRRTPPSELRRLMQESLIKELSSRGVNQVMPFIENFVPVWERDKSYRLAIQSLPSGDSQALIDAINKLKIDPLAKLELMPAVVGSMVSADDGLAAQTISEMPMGEARIRAARELGNALCGLYGVAAINKALDLKLSGLARSELLSVVVGNLAQQDPRAAASFIESSRDITETLRSNLHSALLKSWIPVDAAAALDWAATNLNESDPTSVIQAGFAEWARKAPAEAAAYVSTLQAQGLSIKSSVIAATVGAAWLETDPKAAVEWVSGLQDDREIRRALRIMMRDWVGIDSASATAFVGSFGSTKQADAAFAGVSEGLVSSDPEGSFKILSKIRDDATRREAAYTLIDWYRDIDITTWLRFDNLAREQGFIHNTEPGRPYVIPH